MTSKQTNTLTGINFKIMPNVGYLIVIRPKYRLNVIVRL